MPRALLIAMISCAYVGCGAHRAPDLEAVAVRGGRLRWAVEDAREAVAVRRVATGRPFLAAATGVTPGIAQEAPSSGCRVFRIGAEARRPDGSVPSAADVVRAWEDGLRDPLAPHRWLLAPVDGAAACAAGQASHVSGLRAADRRLEICLTRPTPDLVERLAHVALWVEGPGPFAATEGPAALEANPYATPLPYLDRLIAVTGDVPLLRRVDEVDAVVLRGAAVPAAADRNTDWRWTRAERWDRVYCLAFDPAARWVNDPRLRRWIADHIDRESMLQALFAGRGRVVRVLGLVSGMPWPAQANRPLAPTSVPRLPLRFADDDPHARAIAARLKGEAQSSGIRFQLVPSDHATLRRDLAEGRVPAAIIAHAPFTDDPLLGLLGTAVDLGPAGADARRILEGSSGLGDPVRRRGAARAAEQALLENATLVPLVRVEAWLATRSAVVGVEAGPPGVLLFGRAGWLP